MLIVASVFKGTTINKKKRLDHESLSSPETSILKYHGYIYLPVNSVINSFYTELLRDELVTMNGINAKAPTLYVDLDGTFTKTDLLLESLLIAFKKNPFIIFKCFFWLIKGKAFLKYKLSVNADIRTKSLPLNPEFYAFLQAEKSNGRKIVLATASNEKYSKDICDNFDLFDSYIASDKDTNLKGETKLIKIQSLSERFAYAGNASEDFIIFEHCDESYLVNPTKAAENMAMGQAVTHVFDNTPLRKRSWLKQLRVHQWIKNILIFVPLLVSGMFIDVNAISLSLLGFVSFSCLASATYIINDLLDLESDRSHPRKRNRPLAAGEISIVNGTVFSCVLLVFAFTCALMVNGLFVIILTSYVILTLAYSFHIKQYIGMDVIMLASLYTIRIIAGTAILGVTVSFWLLSFSMFVFFSLALIKRCAELKSFEIKNNTHLRGRDYNTSDYVVLMSIGISSAMLSVLMFCFYVNSNVLKDQYQTPTLLWLVVPVLSYWLMRMWIKTNRGEMHDDPIVYSLKDRGSLITIGIMGLIGLLAQIL